MIDTPPPPASGTSPGATPGQRIAKVLARAGVASRREAEKLITAGRIAVNGTIIDSPALNVTARDKITFDGAPIADAEPARLWLYHKPTGLITTERDEKGRDTVFDNLPAGMPRVVSVGRLDLNSEGLLLLTNDGGVKRTLELPQTGWLRRYRVRLNGRPSDETFGPLRRGITVEGETFQPMEIILDRQQGANAWVTVSIREGKNREIRRAMEAVGLTVNRLIRTSYGPFQLGSLKPGEVEEIRGRVLADQMGWNKDKPKVLPKARVPGKRGPNKGASHKSGKPGNQGSKNQGDVWANSSASGRRKPMTSSGNRSKTYANKTSKGAAKKPGGKRP